MTPPHVLRHKIRELLEDHPELNTSQICRLIHGAKSQHDIDFCRPNKWGVRHDKDGFARRGNNALYVNCHIHAPGYGAIYQALWGLESKGFVETRIEVRNDPIVPTQKDRMRMWGLINRLPLLDSFLEVAEICESSDIARNMTDSAMSPNTNKETSE